MINHRIETKPGVLLDGLHVSMRIVKVIVKQVYNEHGQEPVITSGLEGKHSVGSYHPFGMALDFRTRFFENDVECNIVAQKIQERLGAYYTVIFEGDHIHVQYNWGKF